ncbi:hypothetical protein, partial [Staphylococcus aureus]
MSKKVIKKALCQIGLMSPIMEV